MRYAFIHAHQPQYAVRTLCRVMQVHPSGYYAWRKQPHSVRARDDLRLLGLIKQCWLESGTVYGYRKITHDLRDLGERCAISMALDLDAALLVDDRAARRHAEALGLDVLGTLGVLVLAKRKGLVAEVKPVVQAMRQGGHFISLPALQATLQAAGEA